MQSNQSDFFQSVRPTAPYALFNSLILIQNGIDEKEQLEKNKE
jgi:hypothetical protein